MGNERRGSASRRPACSSRAVPDGASSLAAWCSSRINASSSGRPANRRAEVARGAQKEMDADGEVGCVQQRAVAPLDERLDARQLLPPARRAGHRRQSRLDQPLEVGHCRIRAGELHRHIGAPQPLRRERAATPVLGGADDRMYDVSARAGLRCHRLAHFAVADDHDAHGDLWLFTTEAQRARRVPILEGHLGPGHHHQLGGGSAPGCAPCPSLSVPSVPLW